MEITKITVRTPEGEETFENVKCVHVTPTYLFVQYLDGEQWRFTMFNHDDVVRVSGVTLEPDELADLEPGLAEEIREVLRQADDEEAA